jgi:hypothetical protein
MIFSSIISYLSFRFELLLLRGINTSGREPWEPAFWTKVYFVIPVTVFMVSFAIISLFILLFTGSFEKAGHGKATDRKTDDE